MRAMTWRVSKRSFVDKETPPRLLVVQGRTRRDLNEAVMHSITGLLPRDQIIIEITSYDEGRTT
jgi:hypothetical protein